MRNIMCHVPRRLAEEYISAARASLSVRQGQEAGEFHAEQEEAALAMAQAILRYIRVTEEDVDGYHRVCLPRLPDPRLSRHHAAGAVWHDRAEECWRAQVDLPSHGPAARRAMRSLVAYDSAEEAAEAVAAQYYAAACGVDPMLHPDHWVTAAG